MLKKIKSLFNKGEIHETVVGSLITEDMTLAEVLQRYPQTAVVFSRYGIHCVGCHIANWETLAQGARAHGVDLVTLLKDLNQSLEG